MDGSRQARVILDALILALGGSWGTGVEGIYIYIA